MAHLDEHKILVDYQHGFRQHSSRETQLTNTLEQLARSLNYRTQKDLLILDFTEAFDSVAYNFMLLKLYFYGIRGQTLDWLKAWLANRTQKVVLEWLLQQ